MAFIPTYRLISSGPLPAGRVTIFREPEPYIAYSLGLDFAYGLANGDYDAGVMFDGNGEQVATLHGHWGERFIDVLWPLLQWYKPLVVGERQVGLPTLRRIYDKGYTFLYFDRDHAKRGRERRDALGHHSSKGDTIIPSFRAAISRRDSEGKPKPSMVIRDGEVMDEMGKFQFLPKSRGVTIDDARDGDLRWGAPPGEHDDLVMAAAFGWHGVQWLPQFERPPERFAPMSMGNVFGTPESLALENRRDNRKAWK